MDWDDLRYLLALSRFSTLNQAATHLGVNYTTVSRRLASLQEKAGVRLIEKVGRRYALTEAGIHAVSAAEGMEQFTQDLERRWFGQDARLVGTLRVSTLDILAHVYTDAFAAFARKFPGIQLEINAENRIVSLTRRQADIVIRVSGSPPEHLVGRRVAHFDYWIYGARALLDRIGSGAPLGAHPWIAWDEALGARVTEDWMARHVPDAHIPARADTSMMMISMVRAGVGLAHLPEVIASQLPELVKLQKSPEDFNTHVWLLTHEELRNAARVRVFMDHMAEAEPRWF